MWDSSLALCCFCYLLLIWFSPKSRHNFSLSWYFMSFVTVGRIIKLKYRPCKPLVWVRDTDWWADFSPEWYLFGQTLLWVTNKKEREREKWNSASVSFHVLRVWLGSREWILSLFSLPPQEYKLLGVCLLRWWAIRLGIWDASLPTVPVIRGICLEKGSQPVKSLCCL